VGATVDPGDKPWTPSPHKGWNKTQWLKAKKNEQELEDTLSRIWAELTGNVTPIETQAEVVQILKPVKYEYQPKWSGVDLSIVNELIQLYNHEIQRRKRLLQDDEDILYFL